MKVSTYVTANMHQIVQETCTNCFVFEYVKFCIVYVYCCLLIDCSRYWWCAEGVKCVMLIYSNYVINLISHWQSDALKRIVRSTRLHFLILNCWYLQQFPPSATTLHFEYYEESEETKVEKKERVCTLQV